MQGISTNPLINGTHILYKMRHSLFSSSQVKQLVILLYLAGQIVLVLAPSDNKSKHVTIKIEPTC